MLANTIYGANAAAKKATSSMSPLDLMSAPSITGGAAAPSNATSGNSSYVAMNNPFSFADDGGKSNATAENAGAFDPQVLLLMLLIGGAVLVMLK